MRNLIQKKELATKARLVLGVLTLFAMVFVSCQRRSDFKVNLSGVAVEPVTIKRYEEVLFKVNPYNLRQEIDPYIKDFAFFLGDALDTPWGQQQLFDYMTDDYILKLYRDVSDAWTSLEGLEMQLTDAFRYLRYYYPEFQQPQVYSYVSGLDYHLPVKYVPGYMVIGLDMYLGESYKEYGRIGIPAYKVFQLTPDYVVIDAMRAIASDFMQRSVFKPETYLDYMIFEGKMLYFLDCMLPAVSDHMKIGFTPEQFQWAERNQGYAWAYYLDNEFMYSTDRMMINKFVGDGPFTAPFGNNSAPRMAVFSGWQIVRAYMRRNPEVSLQELMAQTNAREILSKSAYKPR